MYCMLSAKRWRTAATLRGSNHERSARRSPRRFARMFPSRSATRKLQKKRPKTRQLRQKWLLSLQVEKQQCTQIPREKCTTVIIAKIRQIAQFFNQHRKNGFVKVWHFVDLPPFPQMMNILLIPRTNHFIKRTLKITRKSTHRCASLTWLSWLSRLSRLSQLYRLSWFFGLSWFTEYLKNASNNLKLRWRG